jgi:hypothetical protein
MYKGASSVFSNVVIRKYFCSEVNNNGMKMLWEYKIILQGEIIFKGNDRHYAFSTESFN